MKFTQDKFLQKKYYKNKIKYIFYVIMMFLTLGRLSNYKKRFIKYQKINNFYSFQQKPHYESIKEAFIKYNNRNAYFDLFNKYYRSNTINNFDNEEIIIFIASFLEQNFYIEATDLLKKYVDKYGKQDLWKLLPVAQFAFEHGIIDEKIEKANYVYHNLKKNSYNIIDFLNKKSIAIVGNGPSEIGKCKGKEIDAHDIVIRINNYETSKYKTDYGEKTDIWIRGFGGKDLKDYTEKNKYMFAGITGDFERIPVMYEFQLDILYRDLKNNIKTGYLSSNFYHDLLDEYPIEPTTGLVLIYELLKNNQNISLYGFSFQQTQINDYATHYFSDRNKKTAKKLSKVHSFTEETIFLLNLLNKYNYFNKYKKDNLNNVKISVIVPTYNVELYIDKCIRSLVNQTLKDIEIICVDDCSTDNTPNLLEEYAYQYNIIKLVKLNKNLGVSHARNRGLEIAKGEYVSFIDSDDWVDLDFCENLYKIAKKNCANVVKGKMLPVSFKDNKNRKNFSKKNSLIKKSKYCFLGEFYSAIYNRKFLLDNNIKFPEDIITSEDYVFSVLVASKCNKIYFADSVYYYLQRSNSKVKTLNSKKLESIFSCAKKIVNIINESLISEKEYNYVVKYVTLLNLSSRCRYVSLSKDETKNCFEKLIHEIKPSLKYRIKEIENFNFEEVYTNLNKVNMNLIQQIFSIKNNNKHKVITILGIKIKFKRKCK